MASKTPKKPGRPAKRVRKFAAGGSTEKDQSLVDKFKQAPQPQPDPRLMSATDTALMTPDIPKQPAANGPAPSTPGVSYTPWESKSSADPAQQARIRQQTQTSAAVPDYSTGAPERVGQDPMRQGAFTSRGGTPSQLTVPDARRVNVVDSGNMGAMMTGGGTQGEQDLRVLQAWYAMSPSQRGNAPLGVLEAQHRGGNPQETAMNVARSRIMSAGLNPVQQSEALGRLEAIRAKLDETTAQTNYWQRQADTADKLAGYEGQKVGILGRQADNTLTIGLRGADTADRLAGIQEQGVGVQGRLADIQGRRADTERDLGLRAAGTAETLAGIEGRKAGVLERQTENQLRLGLLSADTADRLAGYEGQRVGILGRQADSQAHLGERAADTADKLAGVRASEVSNDYYLRKRGLNQQAAQSRAANDLQQQQIDASQTTAERDAALRQQQLEQNYALGRGANDTNRMVAENSRTAAERDAALRQQQLEQNYALGRGANETGQYRAETERALGERGALTQQFAQAALAKHYENADNATKQQLELEVGKLYPFLAPAPVMEPPAGSEMWRPEQWAQWNQQSSNAISKWQRGVQELVGFSADYKRQYGRDPTPQELMAFAYQVGPDSPQRDARVAINPRALLPRTGYAGGGMVYGTPSPFPVINPIVQQYRSYVMEAKNAGAPPVSFQQFVQMKTQPPAAPPQSPTQPGALGMAGGGSVPVAGKMVVDTNPQAPTDSIPAQIDGKNPAALNSGEFVIPTDVVRFYGTKFFDGLLQKARQNGQS